MLELNKVYNMDFLNKLNKQELIELIKAYDEYIQDANDGDLYKGGDFYPVCIDEFYNNDFEYWKEDKNENR